MRRDPASGGINCIPTRIANFFGCPIRAVFVIINLYEIELSANTIDSGCSLVNRR